MLMMPEKCVGSGTRANPNVRLRQDSGVFFSSSDSQHAEPEYHEIFETGNLGPGLKVERNVMRVVVMGGDVRLRVADTFGRAKCLMEILPVSSHPAASLWCALRRMSTCQVHRAVL